MQHGHFAGTEKRLEVDAEREAIESEWSTKSRYILSELGTACSAFAPAEQERALAHGSIKRTPSAQCKLAILDSPDGADDRGILEVQVRPSDPTALACARVLKVGAS